VPLLGEEGKTKNFSRIEEKRKTAEYEPVEKNGFSPQREKEKRGGRKGLSFFST